MRNVSVAVLNTTLTFRFKGEPEEILNAYRVEEAFLVRSGSSLLLMGKVSNPQEGKVHYPLIAVEGTGKHFCGNLKEVFLKLLNKYPVEMDLMKLFGSVPQELDGFLTSSSSASKCWRSEEQAPRIKVSDRGVGCKHGYVLATYLVNGGQVTEIDLPSPSTAQAEKKSLTEQILDYAFSSSHLLVVGEQGGGKTYSVWQAINILRSQDPSVKCYYVQGSPALEAQDLLGRFVRTEDGGLKWTNGPLSRAFLRAKMGKKTILFVDEITRIPPSQQGILISALAPVYSRKGYEYFTLVNPINGTEVWCPSKNLWVVGTGNLGAEFSYSALSDVALMERFVTLWVFPDEEDIKRVLEPLLNERGWSDLLPTLLKLRRVGIEFRDKGELSTPPSLRVLKRAIMLSASKEDLPYHLINCFPAMSWEERTAWVQVVDRVFRGV